MYSFDRDSYAIGKGKFTPLWKTAHPSKCGSPGQVTDNPGTVLRELSLKRLLLDQRRSPCSESSDQNGIRVLAIDWLYARPA
jgi:hypothetical protein